jgi:hypothetical protein
VTAQRIGEPGFGNRRRFHPIGYRHGHSQAVVRGLPDPDEEDGGAELWIIDFLFVGVVRASCWKDFERFEIRHPSAVEMTVLEGRLGRFRQGESVFLLEAGTIESHIVAARVYWAEFDLGGGAPSPLASRCPRP